MPSVVYPGSFNPITYGHQDIVERALGLFDKVVVAVGTSADKDPATYLADRINLCREALAEFGDRVEVEGFNILLVEYVLSKNTRFIVRGLRTITDFDYDESSLGAQVGIRAAADFPAVVLPVVIPGPGDCRPRRRHRRVRASSRG